MNYIDPVNGIKELRALGYNYFVGAFSQIEEDKVDVYHIVGYKEKPSNIDFSSLITELAIDEDFSMTHLKFQKDYVLMEFDETFFV